MELDELEKKLQTLKQSGKDSIYSGILFKTIDTKETLNSKIHGTKIKIANYLKRIENINQNKELFTGVVFASFKNAEDYERYYDFFAHSLIGSIFIFIEYYIAKYLLCCCYSKGRLRQLSKAYQLRVEKSAEPADVIWENLQYSAFSKIKRTFFVYLLSFVLIIICFFIILGLNYLQWKNQNQKTFNSATASYILSLVITGVISGINYMLSVMMTKLTSVEKVNTMTNYYLSLSIKISLVNIFKFRQHLLILQ